MNFFSNDEAKYQALFKSLDKDGSGQIDKNDLAKGLLSFIPKGQIEMLIKLFDKTNDGKLEYWEFKEAMKKLEGKK